MATATTTANKKTTAKKPAAKAATAGRPAFPAVDFSRFDLSKLRDLELPKIDVPGVDTDKLVGALRDAAYITIGFGVLTFQQAQVRRRELVDALSERFGTARPQMDELLTSFEERLRSLDARLVEFEAKYDARVESVIDQLEGKLPEPAGALLGQAHQAAKAARKQVRGLLRSAA